MRISQIHGALGGSDLARVQGPLVNTQTGLRSRRNRGVRRAWKLAQRKEAETRQAATEHERTKAHRLAKCTELVCHQ